MIVVHAGSPESVAWVAARLREAADVAAADPDAPLEDRPATIIATADREALGRRRQHHGSFSMETLVRSPWNGDRTVRISLVRGSSTRHSFELPLPPGPLEALVAGHAGRLAAMAAMLRGATVLREPPAALEDALDRIAVDAVVRHPDEGDCAMVAARTPWHPPEASVLDRRTWSCAPLRATPAAVAMLDAAVPAPALRMVDASAGTYALVPLRLDAPLVQPSVVDAMRTIARGGPPLCAQGRRRRRTW